MGVSMEKLQAEAPHLVDLHKKVEAVSLAKGMPPSSHPAEVVGIFDSSPSNELKKNRNYTSGLVPDLSDLLFAAAATFDNDGEVPFGYFGNHVNDMGVVSLAQSNGFVARTWRQNRIGGTNYRAALQWIFRQLKVPQGTDIGQPGGPLRVRLQRQMPLFAIFATDGAPLDDPEKIIEYVCWLSQFPIFIKFVGVGLEEDFEFLQRLSSLRGGRLIDNVGFFDAMKVLGKKRPSRWTRAIEPADPQRAVLEALLNEYPDYYRAARGQGLIVQ